MTTTNGQFETVAMHAWDAAAPLWTELVRSPGSDPYRELALLPAVFELLGDVHDTQVLDAGCGEGSLARMLADRGARVTGIDISGAQIRAAQWAERGSKRNIAYFQRSITNLSGFAPQYFDAVLANQLFVSVADHASAFRQAAQVLAPGGALVVSILHPWTRGPGPGWIQTGRGVRWYPDRYLHRLSSFAMFGTPTPARLPIHHRPLSDYLASAFSAGLALNGFVEPVLPEWAGSASQPVVPRECAVPLMVVLRFTK